MEIRDLLPIGSVVLLEEGEKRLMVIGVKQTDTETNEEYDYLGLMYPEGYLTPDAMFFFNHEDIARIYYLGMEDEEREVFLNRLETYYLNR